MGHVFHLAWYMNGVGFGDSSRTSVPKIMASDPPVSVAPSVRRLYKHLWLLWKDTVRFHLVHSRTFSKTKIKYFLGEDGYILYKVE